MTAEKSILIIDDDIDILYMLSEICKHQGWKPRTAAGYDEAAGYLTQCKRGFDLVLVDYHMPGKDGIAAVKEIRKGFSTVPILVLTVEASDEIVDKFMAAGATDYALKPIKAVDLISRMRVHLQYSERNQYYESHTKGISGITLKVIRDYLSAADNLVFIDELEQRTNIKRKTIYRYLQYMVKEEIIEAEHVYQTTGRPKLGYRMKSKSAKPSS